MSPDPLPPWFKLWRKIFDSRVWQHPIDRVVFIWLMGHADMNGQLTTTLGEIQRGCPGLGREQVRASIARMSRFSEVHTTYNQRSTQVSICKWGVYQGPATNLTHNLQPNSTLSPINKVPVRKRVEVRDKSSQKNSLVRSGPRTSERFAEFWQAYPKKTGKKPCEAKWKARGLDALADRIVADVLERKAKHRPWLEGFVPNPLTYLNQDRWEDDLDTASPGGNGSRPAIHLYTDEELKAL